MVGKLKPHARQHPKRIKSNWPVSVNSADFGMLEMVYQDTSEKN